MFYTAIIASILTVWSRLMLMLVCIFWLDVVVLKAEPNPDTSSTAGLGLKDCNLVHPHKLNHWSLTTGCIWLELVFSVSPEEHSQVLWKPKALFSPLEKSIENVRSFHQFSHIKLSIQHPLWLVLWNLHNTTASCSLPWKDLHSFQSSMKGSRECWLFIISSTGGAGFATDSYVG